MRVLVTSGSFGKCGGEARRMLECGGFEIVDNPYGRILNEAEFSEAIRKADAVILGTERLTAQVLQSAPQLQFVARYGVGTDNMDLAALAARGIGFDTARGCNHEAVADYTVGLMLDAARGIGFVAGDLRGGLWKKRTGLDLYGKTVGVIGLGAIGKAVVRRLAGFSTEICGFDLMPDREFCDRHGVRLTSVEEICRVSDVVTLHVPALPDGRALIGRAELSLMKRTAILVNTARASLVDDDALVEALEGRRIFAAAIDAPLSMAEVDARYLRLDNAIVTPHNAAVSVEAAIRMSEAVASQILAYFKTRQGEDAHGQN